MCWLSARVCWWKRELVAVLAACSCVLGEEGAGRCAGCLLVCSRVKESWALC